MFIISILRAKCQYKQRYYPCLFTLSVSIVYYVCHGKICFWAGSFEKAGIFIGSRHDSAQKYCSFDCIYCQIGKTNYLEIERRRFFDPDEIMNEVIRRVSEVKRVDFVTFSGSGEPTLNSDLGYMIREIKKRTRVPIAVITNGSLLFQEEVRRDLLEADVVLPSLDAASDDIFHYINRPHPLIGLKMIIDGLKEFRRMYKGEIWLEIMMIKDVNDDPEELSKFKRIPRLP